MKCLYLSPLSCDGPQRDRPALSGVINYQVNHYTLGPLNIIRMLTTAIVGKFVLKTIPAQQCDTAQETRVLCHVQELLL